VTSKTTGALQVTGGVGIQGDIHATHANLEDVEADSVTVTDATAATDKTTGALKVTGGVGIQGDLYATDGHFSTDVSVGSLTNKYIPYANASKILTDSQISQEADGTIVISNDVEISGSLLVQGDSFEVSAGQLVVQDRIIDIANNNPDHTLDIGILMEHPGHNIGIIHHDTDELTIGYTQAGYSDNHVYWDTSNHITMNVWGHVITQNTVTVEYNDVYIVGGGLGIGIGDRGDGTPDANIHVVGNVFVTSNITTSSNVLITGDAAATSKTTGALQVAGGVGVQGDIYATHANLEDVEADSVTITDTTTSTSTTTGALKVAGGVSTQEKLNVGGVTKIWDSTAVTGKTDGALVVVGGVGISGDIHATHANLEDVEADSVTVTDTTTSTSTTTGALKVAGGVSTQEKLNVGGVTKIWDSTAVTGKTDGALVVVGGVGISGDIHATHANLEDVEADSVNVTDTTAATNKTSGALQVAGGVGVSGALYGAAATFDGVTSVTNATAATGKTDGALVVTGGVGVSGALYGAAATFDGVTSVTNATAATGKTDGALVVTGGVGVSGALYGAAATFDGVTSVTNATAATSKTDGALVVTGGVGVSGALYGAAATFDDLTVDGTTLTVDTVNNRVGIGMNNPGFTLDITGDINFSGSLYEGGSLFVSTPWTIETGPDALSYTSGNIGIGVANPPAKLTVQGGTIINSDQVAKKTYSYSGELASAQTIANSTIKLTFTNHTFSAKVVAHLIESDDEVSTLSFECCGGNWSGSAPANNIALGPVTVFGPSSTNPWDSTVTTTTTTVSFKPTTNMVVAGHYNVFVEYFSQNSAGELTSLHEGATAEVSDFGY
jgi:hypothetical protein